MTPIVLEVLEHRTQDLENRMKRVEKFILSTLVLFAMSSTFLIYLVTELPSSIEAYNMRAIQIKKVCIDERVN